jgi:hypothetical protein
VIDAYHRLLGIEKAFRMPESDLQVRPVYHCGMTVHRPRPDEFGLRTAATGVLWLLITTFLRFHSYCRRELALLRRGPVRSHLLPAMSTNTATRP